MKHFKYLKYVLKHKWFVFIECCRLGIPVRGLLHDLSKFRPSEWFPYVEKFYGGWKDIDAFHPVTESFSYAWLLHQHRNPHHWQYWLLRNDNEVRSERSFHSPKICLRDLSRGNVKAGDAMMNVAADAITEGYRQFDLYDQCRWLNIVDAEENPLRETGFFFLRHYSYSSAIEMPMKYRKEMLADWIGAGMAIHGRRDIKEWFEKHRSKMMIGPKTMNWLEAKIDTEETSALIKEI